MKKTDSRPRKLPRGVRILIKTLLCVIAAVILAAIIYVAYVLLSYSRIEDNQDLQIESNASQQVLQTGQSYTIVTQNLGFGAYTADFTFFMDGGKLSRAVSAESVTDCITQGAETAVSFEPDFVLFQEVDTDSTRSYHIDESAILAQYFSDYDSVAAINYHSAYLMYPLLCPHGASNSEIMTFSRYALQSSVRRSLPVSTGLSKLLDLDRCYSVSRIACDNGHELVLYNTHMSAYGGSDALRAAQMSMLFEDMYSEYQNGNYVVCGGDFNHDFTGTATVDLNGEAVDDFGWAQPFPAELLPKGLSRAMDYEELVGSCRNCDVPYEEGNFVTIVDGFLVSDNITVDSVKIIDTGFVYSDHNPVVMQFTPQT